MYILKAVLQVLNYFYQKNYQNLIEIIETVQPYMGTNVAGLQPYGGTHSIHPTMLSENGRYLHIVWYIYVYMRTWIGVFSIPSEYKGSLIIVKP